MANLYMRFGRPPKMNNCFIITWPGDRSDRASPRNGERGRLSSSRIIRTRSWKRGWIAKMSKYFHRAYCPFRRSPSCRSEVIKWGDYGKKVHT
jgi:hypothetical protein